MLKYWLWLSLLQGVPRRKKVALIQQFPCPEDIYLRVDYSDVYGLTEQEQKALNQKDLTDAQQTLNICKRKGIHIVTIGEKEYPDRLRNIADPPILLYYRGVLPDLDAAPAIGIVGTRKNTAYGTKAAQQFGKEIAEGGGIVISGGAKGIDSEALRGALDGGGLTVAVLGCGVDITYPSNNRQLFDAIWAEGCLMSEYPPGDKPEGWHFPERNRIISGLSDAIVVIEAPKPSGALITAEAALEQGKDVFAVPGNIDMPTCRGSNELLRNGAMVALSGLDVMNAYMTEATKPRLLPERAPVILAQTVKIPVIDKKVVDNPANCSYTATTVGQTELSDAEQRILNCLSPTPKPMDEVLAQIELAPGEAFRLITRLSLKGLVENHPGKMISAKIQHK